MHCVPRNCAPGPREPRRRGLADSADIHNPAGQSDAFLHAYCPTGYTVTNGAAFAATNVALENGFVLTGQGPRLDLSPPKYNEWVWNFEWPAGGAAAGTQIIANVDCKKGAP